MPGFKADEVMVGTHMFRGESRPLHFTLTWCSDSFLQLINPFSDAFLFNQARGVITVGGLVDKAECRGTLHLKYFKDRTIRYDLEFADSAGKRYLYVGEKVDLWPWNLHRTHVTCYGRIIELESGQVISESVVRFPYREMLPFVMSMRIKTSPIFLD